MYKKIIWVLISVMIIFVSSMSIFSNSAGSSGYIYAKDHGGCGNNNEGGNTSEEEEEKQNPSDETNQSSDPQGNDPEDQSENDITPTDTTAPTPTSTASEATDDPNMSNADPDMSEKSALPKTGEQDNITGIVIGGSLILISAGYIIFRRKQVQ